MLLAGLSRQAEQELRKSVLDGRRRLQHPLHLAVGLVPVEGERLQIERALVAEGVVQTLPGDAHRLHQGPGRRVLVSKTPEDAHRLRQRALRVKSLPARHTGPAIYRGTGSGS